MTSRRSSHDNDFYACSREQALLRAGRVGEADLATIAGEIESMGKTERRELVGRLTVLPLHLLKWERQPAGSSNSWRLTIADARDEIADLLEDNPSLKAVIDAVMASAYRYARREAVIETDMAQDAFPAQCPWNFARVMDEALWPVG